MAVQIQISYSYDALDRLVEARYSDGSLVSYTYDSAGNLTAVMISGTAVAPAQPAPAAVPICPQCGSPVGAGVQFCTACGKKLG